MSGSVVAAAEGASAGGRVTEIHKSLLPQREPLVHDEETSPADPFGFLQGPPAVPGRQAPSAPALWNADKTHMAQVARATAFQLEGRLGEVEGDSASTAAQPTQREEDRTGLMTPDNDAAAKPAIVKERYPKVWNDVSDTTSQTPAG